MEKNLQNYKKSLFSTLKNWRSHFCFISGASSPPSEFYNILIDDAKVKCLICANIVGHFDLKADSIVLDIEKIRLVRIEPRNLTAVCTAKESYHSHEMLVSSAYCDTVYKSYTKPEFHSVSRYKTLKQPCPLLPDQILGFDFIASISRSFRYLRVHRFRHPSSLCGVTNPLAFTNLHSSIFSVSSTDLLTALSPDTSTVSADSISTSQAASGIDVNVDSDSIQSTGKSINNAVSHPECGCSTANQDTYHFQQVFFLRNSFPSSTDQNFDFLTNLFHRTFTTIHQAMNRRNPQQQLMVKVQVHLIPLH